MESVPETKMNIFDWCNSVGILYETLTEDDYKAYEEYLARKHAFVEVYPHPLCALCGEDMTHSSHKI